MLRCNICLHVLRNCCAISAPSYLFCFIAQRLYFFGVSVCIYFALGKLSRIVHVSCICASCVHEGCSFCSLRMLEAYAAHVALRTCACLAHFVCLPCSCFAFLLRMCSVFVDLFCLLRAFVVHRLCVCCMFVVCLLCICCAYCMQLLCIWSAHVVHLLPRIARIRCVCCVLAAHLLLRIACIRAMFFFAGLLCVRCCV